MLGRPFLVPFLVGFAAVFASTSSVTAAEGQRETKRRVFVLTDVSNEPDDEESLVRFLVYSNEFDVEGLVATTSTWLRNRTREDLIRILQAEDDDTPKLDKASVDAPFHLKSPRILRCQSPTPAGTQKCRRLSPVPGTSARRADRTAPEGGEEA